MYWLKKTYHLGRYAEVREMLFSGKRTVENRQYAVELCSIVERHCMLTNNLTSTPWIQNRYNISSLFKTVQQEIRKNASAI